MLRLCVLTNTTKQSGMSFSQIFDSVERRDLFKTKKAWNQKTLIDSGQNMCLLSFGLIALEFVIHNHKQQILVV